ncbi:hypothetical protein SDC9_80441 [bioreactor metagenome]|uniref:Uncharacterized protein n=1 Tax=bioreactor metagenome TaxID=1076179 RepID=A0A644YZ31_9ZZZZ
MDDGSGDSCGDYNSRLLELKYCVKGIPVFS